MATREEILEAAARLLEAGRPRVLWAATGGKATSTDTTLTLTGPSGHLVYDLGDIPVATLR